MRQNPNRDIRQLYKVSSAGPEFRRNDDNVLLEKCYHIDSGREYSLQTLIKTSKSVRCGSSTIKSLLELDHPNIMKIYDFFETDDHIQIVFQKSEGTTLLRELQRSPGFRFKEKSSSQIISQILSSVKYLHRKRLLLRGISLDNILIISNSSGYDVKITEFGVQALMQTKSCFQGMLGEGYDLFSIGLIAFSLVTGIFLIVEKGNEEKISLSLQSRQEFQGLSSNCKSFILACLSNISIFSTNSDSLQQHPWLYLENEVISEISSETFVRLKDYLKKSTSERILTFAVSQSLTTTQLESIKAEFLKFDEKFTGEISYSGFRKAFQNINEEETIQYFSAINILRTNTISYHEFISALMTERIVSERNIRSTFLQLCCCNQEYLMLTDIRKYFDSDCSMEYVLSMFNEAGLSADSFLSYNRFKKCLGFHCTERVALQSTEPPKTAEGTETCISPAAPSATTASSCCWVNEEIASRRRLQSMTENMVTESTHIDVRSLYAVDNRDVLGAGASGKVYRCKHRMTGVTYAMKSIDISNESETKIDMLRQEIRIMAKLDHPHILRLHESFETSSTIYLILDLCTGGELLDSLNELPSRRYSEKAACRLICDILGAVRYCHDHGIAHRDLKLENFLLESSSENATIKIIDFGLSCYFNRSHYMTECIGTPYYVAPEVLSKQYNEKCDVWSVGVIAYMLMTGTPLFDGDDDNDILRAVAKGHVEYCSRFRTISTAGQEFINSCLTRNPDDRPSAQEAQSHSWFRSLQNKRPPTIPPQIISNLQQFLSKRPMSRLFMFALAHSQKDEYLVDVHQTFTAINTSKSGEINYEELRAALLGKFSTKDISSLCSMMDVEHIGRIRYHQFMAATFTLAELRERRWKMAFYKISSHRESFTISDVEMLLGKTATKKTTDILLLDWSEPSSASISFSEFRNIVNGAFEPGRKAIADTVLNSPTTITTRFSFDNVNMINKAMSTDSKDIPMTARPPTSLSLCPHHRRNTFRDNSQRSSSPMSPSSLPAIAESTEVKPSEQLFPVLAETKTIDSSTIKPSDNSNNSNSAPKNTSNLNFKISQEVKLLSAQGETFINKLNERKPSSICISSVWDSSSSSSTSPKPAQTSKRTEAVSPLSISVTRGFSATKFRSVNDLPSLPSICISPSTSTKSPNKASFGNRTRP